MEIKVIAVEIPCAECMAKVYEKVREEQNKEHEAWRAQIEKDTQESIPKLIGFLSNLIVEKTSKGEHTIDLNLVDSFMENRRGDSRISYFFKGEFSYSVADKIEEVFKACGYYAWVKSYQWVNGSCYRSGQIILRW